MKTVRQFLSQSKAYYLQMKRKKFLGSMQDVVNKDTSIISNNCFAGRIYQDFGYSYTTPTVGLYIFFPDYIEFLKDLSNSLNGKLEFVDVSKYAIGNERMRTAKHKYPVALLNNKIEINFLHYKSRAEAEDKWYRRCERVNLNNLLVFGSELDRCSSNDIYEFDKLQFARKYFFTCNKYDLNSTIFIDEFLGKEQVGDPYQKGHVFYEYFVNKLKSQK